MPKIIHISDLHICCPETRTSILSALNAFRELLPSKTNLDFHIANNSALEALISKINSIDPDILVITGDITSFGDRPSFEEASRFIDRIRKRNENGATRQVICTPGNHDALADQLNNLHFKIESNALELKWYIFRIVRWALRIYFKPLYDLKKKKLLGGDWSEEQFLNNYKSFLSDAGCQAFIQLDNPVPLKITCITTVCKKPIWMNQGEVEHSGWTSFYDASGIVDRPDAFHIALTHHNPVSMPGSKDSNLEQAYNSTSKSGDLLSKAQNRGVDIILHGHQHVSGIFSYDFNLETIGQSYAVGCGSSTDLEEATFNFIEIHDNQHFQLQKYIHDAERGFVESGKKKELALEKDRPSQEIVSIRREIKDFSYENSEKEVALWRQVHRGDCDFVYISGRRLSAFRGNSFDQVVGLLKDESKLTRVRILITDPTVIDVLIKSLSDREPNVQDHSDYWGDKETLGELKYAATESLNKLESTISRLSEHCQKRIAVHLSHSLLPFGAYVRIPNRRDRGEMGLKLLPIGVMGKFHSPVLRLSRRKDEALYAFYLKYLKELFLNSRHLNSGTHGKWDAGVQDLEEP